MNDVHTLAGAYALDALPAEEREFFERHLSICDACEREVADYAATAALLAADASEPPPGQLRDRVLALVDQTRQQPPLRTAAPADASAARNRFQSWLPSVAAGLAVGVVALSGVAIDLRNEIDTLDRQVADMVLQDDVVEVLAAADTVTVPLEGSPESALRFMYSPSLDRGVLAADGLPAAPPDSVYELWLYHDGQPVPGQLFAPDGQGVAVAVVDGSVAGAEQVAVTVEAQGGALAPTGPAVAHAGL